MRTEEKTRTALVRVAPPPEAAPPAIIEGGPILTRTQRNVMIGLATAFSLTLIAGFATVAASFIKSGQAVAAITTAKFNNVAVTVNSPHVATFDYGGQAYITNFETGDTLISSFQNVGFGGGGAGGTKELTKEEFQLKKQYACKVAKEGKEFEIDWLASLGGFAEAAKENVNVFHNLHCG